MTATTAFDVAAGSIIGCHHARVYGNNQDAYGVRRTDGTLVAVVADGCASGRHSEVGAQLAAAWVTHWAPQFLTPIPDSPLEAAVLAESLSDAVCAQLRFLLEGMGATEHTCAKLVEDYCLFTLLVALVTDERALVFGIGDGVVSVNGEARVLEPAAGNRPAYLGYGLIPDRVAADVTGFTRPKVHHLGPTGDLSSIILATDGAGILVEEPEAELKDGSPAGGIEQFLADRYFRNPSLVRKRLIVLGHVNHRLADDTTVIAIRRREASPCA